MMRQAIWLAQPFLQVALLVAMSRRGLLREFPYFSGYLVLQVLTKAFLLSFRKSQDIYFFGYYVSLALVVLLSVGILVELFRKIFDWRESHRPVLCFGGAAVIFLLLTATLVAPSDHRWDWQTVMGAALFGDRIVRCLQCGMALFLLLFRERLGVSWKDIAFGIAVGFGFYATVDFLVSTGLSHRSVAPFWLLKGVDVVAYDMSLLIWLAYTALGTTDGKRATLRWSY
jgi:hypothetical protein